MPDRPNVVLVCVDQWRGDCLSIDGHPVVKTPYLDQIALGGVRCRKAYSATPTCIPARAALLTGLTQRTHGRVGYRDGVPWDYPVTMAGEFTRHGYQTQCVGKMHVYPERSQMGFQHTLLHDGYLHFARRRERDLSLVDDYIPWLRERDGSGADYFDHGINCNSVVARPWDKAEHLHPTNWVTTQSIDFLRRRDPRKPFFLFMSYHRPHPPYDPPAWAFEQYLGQAMPPVPVGDWTGILEPWRRQGSPEAQFAEMDPVTLHRARAGYYGHMSHIDQQLNRFWEILHEYHLRENTVFCFVSDHGEMMGDHHMYRKGYAYEGSSRVPLILHAPNRLSLRHGTALDEIVELRDVMPTLLDCAGLPAPKSVEGRSFLPRAQGKRAPWRGYLHGEHTIFGQSMHWITDGGEKYVWFSGDGREQLFDLKSDPQELHDLAADDGSAPRVTRLRKLLIRELQGREERFTDGKKLIAGRPVNACLAHLRKQAGIS
jgi:arylsulfatase A-like enzyme